MPDESKTQSPPTGAAPSSDPARRPRRRRWPWVVLIVLVVIAAGVYLLPTIVSTGPVTGWVVSMADARLTGRVSVDDLALTWRGPVTVRGLTIRDPNGQALLTGGEVTLRRGLWGLARDAEDFDRVEVRADTLLIQRLPDGSTTIGRALTPVEPSPPQPDQPLPAPVGKVVVNVAQIQYATADGRRVRLRDLDGQMTLATLDRVEGVWTVAVEPRGLVRVEMDVTGMVADGRADPLSARGTVSVLTPEPVALAPLTDLASAESLLAGEIDANTRVDLTGGQVVVALDQQVAPPAGSVPPERRSLQTALRGQLRLGRDADGSIRATEGTLRVPRLILADRAMLDKPIELSLREVGYNPAGGSLSAELIRLTGDAVSASVEALQLQTAGAVQATGRVAADADFDKLLPMVYQLAGRTEPPELRGRASMGGTFSAARSAIVFSGDGTVTGLAAPGMPASARPEKLELSWAVEADPSAKTLRIRTAKVDSDMLNLDAGGTIDDLDGAMLADLSGEYEGDWDRILPILHELAPETAETIRLRGPAAGRFAFQGPLAAPELGTGKVTGTARVGWEGGNVYGLSLGEGSLEPKLSGGRVRLPMTTIPAGGGQLNVTADVDLEPDTPVLRIPGTVDLAKGVRIDREMSRQLLSRANPIFARLASAEGTVSLRTEEVVMPLGQAALTGGSGRGRLDLSGLRVQPEGLLQLVLRLAGVTRQGPISLAARPMEFTLRDGRLAYNDFTLKVSDEVSLTFFGSVGFDDKLDLAVRLPIGAPLLERFGVGGEAAEYARLLGGAGIEVPIVGTRLDPRLDMSKVDIKPLIRQAARRLLAEKAGEVIGGAAGRDDPNRPRRPLPAPQPTTRPDPETPPAPTTRPAPEREPEEILRDSVIDLLGEVIRQRTERRSRREPNE